MRSHLPPPLSHTQTAAEKTLKPSSRSIKFKRYSNFFVNSRSVESVRGNLEIDLKICIFHVDPSGNVKKSSSKIKFRVDYISRFAPF